MAVKLTVMLLTREQKYFPLLSKESLPLGGGWEGGKYYTNN